MSHLNAEEVRKLDAVIKAGVDMKERHKVERESLNDSIKALAESTGMKPKSIRTAIGVAFKANFQEESEFHDEVSTILESTGRV
jgi:hypothetical protein